MKKLTIILLIIGAYFVGAWSIPATGNAEATLEITNSDDLKMEKDVVPFTFTETEVKAVVVSEKLTKNDAIDNLSRATARYIESCDPAIGTLVLAKEKALSVLNSIETEILKLPEREIEEEELEAIK